MRREDRSDGRAWLALTGALALHVVDEALTGFLDLWNPMMQRLRAALPWSPIPTLSFGAWLSGLAVLIVVLALLAGPALAGARWLRPLGYAYGTIMLLNSLAHAGASIYLGRLAPGFLSSPLLLICSVWLLASLIRSRPGRADPIP